MATRREEEKKKRRKSDAQMWAQQQKDNGGSTSYCLKLPRGVSFYKLTPGTHDLDFMPFLAGKNNPRADEGMEHFERQYDAHRIQTADGTRMFACRLKCFGKACYACDWLRTQSRTADEAMVKQVRCTTRHLWLVNDKPGDPTNPLKVFDTNHYNKGMGFGEMMADALADTPEYRNFSDLENGFTLRLKVKEDTFPGGKYNKVVRIDFLPRKYKYPDELIETAPCLDDCIVCPSNEDFKLHMEGSAGEDEDDKPSKNPSRFDDDEDDKPSKKQSVADDFGLEVGDEVEYEGQTYEITSISRDGTSLTLEDEEGDTVKGVSPDEVEKVEKKKPAKPSKKVEEDKDDDKPAKKPVVNEDDEDDEDDSDDDDLDDDDDMDDDEDDLPAKKSASKVVDEDDDEEDDLEDEDDDDFDDEDDD